MSKSSRRFKHHGNRVSPGDDHVCLTEDFGDNATRRTTETDDLAPSSLSLLQLAALVRRASSHELGRCELQ